MVVALIGPMSDTKGHMMRNKTMIAIGLLAAFALPASAAAKPPSKADKRSAAKECKAERGTDDATRAAFEAKYGSLGTCVSAGARERKAERKAERKEARRNAARECRAEREDAGVDAFREEYGTNGSKRNAFGKCVSARVKQERDGGEQEDKAAA